MQNAKTSNSQVTRLPIKMQANKRNNNLLMY